MSYNTVSRESTVGEEQGEQAALVAGSARSAASGRAGRQRLVLGCLGFLMEVSGLAHEGYEMYVHVHTSSIQQY